MHGAFTAILGRPPLKWCGNARWFLLLCRATPESGSVSPPTETMMRRMMEGVQLFALQQQNSTPGLLLCHFLKHQFAWDAVGNTHNRACGAFITFMTPRKSDILQAIKQIISIYNTFFTTFNHLLFNFLCKFWLSTINRNTSGVLFFPTSFEFSAPLNTIIRKVISLYASAGTLVFLLQTCVLCTMLANKK